MASPSSSTATLRQRFLGELINSVTVLDSVESAAVGEAWASSAVAEWLALEGASGQLASELGDFSVAAGLVGWIEGDEPPGGSEWLADVGSHRAVLAWEISDPGQPRERGLIMTYEAASSERHDVSVTIRDGSLAAIVIGPTGLAEAADADSRDGLVTRELSPTQAEAEVRSSLGDLSDQMSAVSEASLPLVLRRLEMTSATPVLSQDGDAPTLIPDRDAELDRYGADVIRSALRDVLSSPAPDAVNQALEDCQSLFDSQDPDALTLAEVSGVAGSSPLTVDALCQLTGGYLAPVTFDPHSAVEQRALIELEVADWIGVVLGLCRASVGTEVDGAMLIGAINAAPEITTTIPKKDAPALAWAFEAMLYAWEVTGVLVNGSVGPAARWLLAQSAVRVWDAQSA